MPAQRVVVGKGIVEERLFKRGKVEAPGEGPGLVFGQLDQAVAQN